MKRSHEFANSIAKSYGKQSIFYKYWKKILLYTMIPFTLLCLSVYTVVSHNSEQKLFANATSEFEKSLLLLNDEFSALNNSFLSLITDEYIALFMVSPSTESAFYSDFKITDNIKYSLKSRTASSDSIKNIDLYSYTNNYVFSSKAMGYIPLNETTKWIEQFAAQNKQIALFPDPEYGIRVVFSTGMYQNTKDGLISICLNNNILNNINTFSADTTLCLYDKTNERTLIGDSSLAQYFNLTQENSQTRQKNEYLYHAETEFDDIYLLAKCKTPPNEAGASVLFIIISCIIISLILSIVLSFYLSMQLYKSIAVITAEIQKNFGENGITGGSANELKYISLKLLELDSKNKATEKELVNKISSLRLYQTIMLQNQFNPHFIFNTLNSITMILMNQDLTDDRPVDMLALLSKLMRGAVNTEHYIISLENELKYSQTYIELEKIKQNDNFDIEYNIDNELLSQYTIKFILQPILENAFEHGIKKLPSSERGKISLTICRQNDNILISISDNGPGMSEDTLAKLLKQLKEEDLLSSRHIGLCNTNNRIRIYYGEGYGINSIDSNENGTTVTILIPYEQADKLETDL